MPLYQVSALRDVEITFTQIDPLSAPFIPHAKMPRTHEEMARMTEERTISKRTETLTKADRPMVHVIEIFSVRLLDQAGHQEGPTLQNSDIPLPSEIGNRESSGGIIVERTH
jgi:hypothetical protein